MYFTEPTLAVESRDGRGSVGVNFYQRGVVMFFKHASYNREKMCAHFIRGCQHLSYKLIESAQHTNNAQRM